VEREREGGKRGGKRTYKSILPEDLLSQRRQLDVRDSGLPDAVVATDARAQRSSHDLVPVADADDADAVLGEHLLDELNERVRPGDVGE
jgi:hypothetical protein